MSASGTSTSTCISRWNTAIRTTPTRFTSLTTKRVGTEPSRTGIATGTRGSFTATRITRICITGTSTPGA